MTNLKNPTFKELALRFKVAAITLKKIHKAGHLVNVTIEDERITQMRRYLSAKRPLSVAMLLQLLREPALITDLGVYERQGRAILLGIGDPRLGALKTNPWLHIMGASMSEDRSLGVLLDWLQATIPQAGCNYHWIAVRAMWEVPQEKFKAVYARLPRALLNARAHPRLAGWSDADDGVTQFYRPILEFDL